MSVITELVGVVAVIVILVVTILLDVSSPAPPAQHRHQLIMMQASLGGSALLHWDSHFLLGRGVLPAFLGPAPNTASLSPLLLAK